MPRPTDRRLLVLLLLASGALSTGYGVVFTVLDDFRDRYGIAGSSLGLLVAGGFFASFAGQVLLAPQADRGRARSLLLAGLAANVVGGVVFAVGDTLPVLLAARIIGGLGGGAAIPAIRRIVIVSDPGRLGSNLGRMLSIDVAGFALGPVVSALLVGPFGISAPFLVVAVITAVLLAALVGCSVPETAAADRPRERLALDLLRIRPLAGACLVGVAFFAMIGTFDALWALMMADLDAPTWMANVGITVFALPLIVLGSVGGRFAQRFGALRAASYGLLVAAACMASYGLLPRPWMMLVVGLFHALNDALTTTGTGIAVASAAPEERQAAAQGLLGGLQTLMGGLAASAAGLAYELAGRGAAYVGAAVVMAVLVAAGNVLARSGASASASGGTVPQPR